MDKQEILAKAIQKAIDGGWEAEGLGDVETWTELGQYEKDYVLKLLLTEGTVDGFKLIIFSHDFAKALWGEDWANFYEGKQGDTITLQLPNWKGHLANMVVADDPIKYLGESI